MMVPKEKLEISHRSTIVIKEVFANSPRIRSYRITKSHCQSFVASLKPARAARVVADRPQAMATTWRQHASVGLAGRASRGR